MEGRKVWTNPLEKLAEGKSDEEIEDLLGSYTERRENFFGETKPSDFPTCIYFMSLTFSESGITQKTFQRLCGAASKLAEEYLGKELFDIPAFGGLCDLFDDRIEAERSKLLDKIRRTPKGTMYEDDWGYKNDIYRALLFMLAHNQKDCSNREKQNLEEFWRREVQDKEYCLAAFCGLWGLDESRAKEWYDLLKKVTGDDRMFFGMTDILLQHEGLDKKYGIELVHKEELK